MSNIDGKGGIPEEEKSYVTDVTDTKHENKKSELGVTALVYDAVSVIVSSIVIITLLFTFAFRVVGVDGQSMENTLESGNWVLTYQRSAYEYGDIVVISQPNYFGQPLIKRVIATGGQTVDIDYMTSTVYVDGKALYEPYTKDSYILPKGDDISFPYTVPEGHLFCMGDNRNGSTDCRSTLIGPVDERYVLGKAFIRIVPFGDFNIYETKGGFADESGNLQ